jgi:hypothetical protein
MAVRGAEPLRAETHGVTDRVDRCRAVLALSGDLLGLLVCHGVEGGDRLVEGVGDVGDRAPQGQVRASGRAVQDRRGTRAGDLMWVDWYDTGRLHPAIGYVPRRALGEPALR